MYKLLITASGTGSRMNELTGGTLNKSLIPLGGKPVINHILDYYDSSIPVVMTIGHLGDQVKAHIEQAYPERDITFVQVDLYQGPGSSLAYSMLLAQDYLDCPFVFHACDTLLASTSIPAVEENWVMGYKCDDATQYTSFNIGEDGFISEYNKGKGAEQFDLAHIGLVGITSHEQFRATLQNLYDATPEDSSLNDVVALAQMIEQGVRFRAIAVSDWLDTGNMKAFAQAREALE